MSDTLTSEVDPAAEEQAIASKPSRRFLSLRRSPKRLLVGIAVGVIALGTAAVASAGPASAATSYYGETPYMHCVPGQVTLSSIRIPTAEVNAGPVTFGGEVDIYYSGAWHYWTTVTLAGGGASTQSVRNGGQNENQLPMTATVPHGYYYAVVAYVRSVTHGTVGIQATVDGWPTSAAYAGNYYCAA